METGKKIIVGAAGATGTGLVIYGIRKALAKEEEVYICPECGASFATYDELVAHMITEHPEVPAYPCPLCDAAFYTQEELDAHMITEHPEEPPPLPPVTDLEAAKARISQILPYVQTLGPSPGYFWPTPYLGDIVESVVASPAVAELGEEIAITIRLKGPVPTADYGRVIIYAAESAGAVRSRWLDVADLRFEGEIPQIISTSFKMPTEWPVTYTGSYGLRVDIRAYGDSVAITRVWANNAIVLAGMAGNPEISTDKLVYKAGETITVSYTPAIDPSFYDVPGTEVQQQRYTWFTLRRFASAKIQHHRPKAGGGGKGDFSRETGLATVTSRMEWLECPVEEVRVLKMASVPWDPVPSMRWVWACPVDGVPSVYGIEVVSQIRLGPRPIYTHLPWAFVVIP